MYSREARAAMARIALGMLDDVLAINPAHKEALREKAALLQTQKELTNEVSEAPLTAQRPPADELGVRSALRAIISSLATYSAVCGGGFYAPTLAALAKPQPGEQFGSFASGDVPSGGAKILEKHRCAIERTASPSPKSPAGQSAQTWTATARPLTGYSGKPYKIDAEGALTEIK